LVLSSRESVFFFPDNTVLNNFAIIGQMKMLAKLIGDRGHWCATVAQECRKGAGYPGLEEMATADGIFGEPLYPVGADRINIGILREKMAEPGDDATKHLGEAETIVIIQSQGFHRSFFVTDDVGAQREAKLAGIATVTTWQILRLLVRGGRLSLGDFYIASETLIKKRRGSPPGWADRQAVERWLNAG
jgi:predicted nucleic acid-binding protein